MLGGLLEVLGIHRRVLSVLLGVVVVLILWESIATIISKPYLPPPREVSLKLISMIEDGEILPHFYTTMYRVFGGLAIASTLGFIFGIIMSQVKSYGKLLKIIVLATYPIPHITLLPIFILALGIGDPSSIALISLITFYPIAISTMEWASRTPRSYVEVLKVLNASRLEIIRHVVIPSSLPGVLTGLRIASNTAFAVVFIAESIAVDRGLGFLVNNYWQRYDYPGMYASIIVLSLSGVFTYLAISLLERRICRWLYV